MSSVLALNLRPGRELVLARLRGFAALAFVVR
jgi:hypothetical protein